MLGSKVRQPHLIPILQDSLSKELTIYVKGFLTYQSSDQDLSTSQYYLKIKQSHSILQETHGWGKNCMIWNWDSGDRMNSNLSKSIFDSIFSKTTNFNLLKSPNEWINFLPSIVPIPLTTIALTIFKFVFSLRKLNPALITLSIAHDLFLYLMGAYNEFDRAKQNAKLYSKDFQNQLEQIGNQYEYVRIVAHSLGCYHTIETTFNSNYKPNEIHLISGATTWKEVQDKIDFCSQDSTFHYYTEKDYILSFLFTLLHGGEFPIGAQEAPKELSSQWKTVHSIACDSSHFNSYLIHNEYHQILHKLLIKKKNFYY